MPIPPAVCRHHAIHSLLKKVKKAAEKADEYHRYLNGRLAFVTKVLETGKMPSIRRGMIQKFREFTDSELQVREHLKALSEQVAQVQKSLWQHQPCYYCRGCVNLGRIPPMMGHGQDAQEPKVCEGGCEGQCEAAPADPAGKASTLKTAVAEALAGSSKVVFDRVKDHLVEEELAKRADLILKGLTKKEEIDRDIKKIKPDPNTAHYDGDGKCVQDPVFTKAQADEMKKLRDQQAKVVKGLESALDHQKPCFKMLKEIIGK